MAIEHADFEGVERLAAVLGADIASTFDNPDRVKLGTCESIEEVVIGEDKLIRFSGVGKGEACTVVLRGASKQILDEAERSLHDALSVLAQMVKNTKVVYGGGCSEMLMARAVEDCIKDQKEVKEMLQKISSANAAATTTASTSTASTASATTSSSAVVEKPVSSMATPGKEVLAIKAFARALRALPTAIADNGGFDSNELVAQLEAAHSSGSSSFGLDMEKGTIGDMAQLKITESLKSKLHVLLSAHEGAEMILRVDEIIKNAPRQRQDPHPHP